MSEEFFKRYQHKIKSIKEIKEIIGDIPRNDKVIMCHGVFDVVVGVGVHGCLRRVHGMVSLGSSCHGCQFGGSLFLRRRMGFQKRN